MTEAPNSRASCVTIDPTAPTAPCAITLCPARRRPCSNSPCHAVRPEIGRLAPTVKSTSPGSGEVACLDGHILRQGTAAIRVREAEHPLSHRQTRRAISEGGDHSGQLVPGDRRCSVTAEAIGPGRGPRQLIPGESRRMNLNDDVVYRCLRLGPLHQLHPGRSRSLVRHNDCLHVNCLLGSLCWKWCRQRKAHSTSMPAAM